jgi:hypothetical protein
MPPFVMPPRGLWPCITVNRSTDPEATPADRLLAWQVDDAGRAVPFGISSLHVSETIGKPSRVFVNGWAEMIRGEYRVDGVLWARAEGKAGG